MNTPTIYTPGMTNSLKYRTTKNILTGRIQVDLELYECGRNGHEHFAATGQTWEKDSRGRLQEACGGCIHDLILKHFPKFKPIVDLHLSDQDGIPMHCTANGFYHYQEGKLEYLQSHLRATDAQVAGILAAMPRTEEEFSHLIEGMGFRAQWKAEAEAGIALLESLRGPEAEKFETRATRPGWVPLTKEQVDLIEERKASGYYTPEAIAARDAEAKAAKKAKKIQEAKDEHARTVRKYENKLMVALYFLERDLDDSNIIYYDHVNTIGFNWHDPKFSTGEKVWTPEEIEEFARTADLSALPAGVQFKMSRSA